MKELLEIKFRSVLILTLHNKDKVISVVMKIELRAISEFQD